MKAFCKPSQNWAFRSHEYSQSMAYTHFPLSPNTSQRKERGRVGGSGKKRVLVVPAVYYNRYARLLKTKLDVIRGYSVRAQSRRDVVSYLWSLMPLVYVPTVSLDLVMNSMLLCSFYGTPGFCILGLSPMFLGRWWIRVTAVRAGRWVRRWVAVWWVTWTAIRRRAGVRQIWRVWWAWIWRTRIRWTGRVRVWICIINRGQDQE